MASGIITGTGTTTPVTGRKISIKLDFAGTASIDIEELMPSGAWVKVATAITADNRQVFESPVPTTLRLNCTAYTNNVEWAVEVNGEDR